jgi:hypothetical protein
VVPFAPELGAVLSVARKKATLSITNPSAGLL